MHTVLIVDDEHGIVEVLTELLSQEGYRVRSAANGRDGLACATECRPDFILLDMMMPVLNGRAMLEQLRAMPAFAKTPVVVMSALLESVAFPANASERLYTAYLRKPFALDVLLNLMQALIRAED